MNALIGTEKENWPLLAWWKNYARYNVLTKNGEIRLTDFKSEFFFRSGAIRFLCWLVYWSEGFQIFRKTTICFKKYRLKR